MPAPANQTNIRCAVRTGSGPSEARALDEILHRHAAWQVVRFAAKDEDELNAELCAGRFEIVVFATLDALLNAIWKGDADIAGWRAAGVRIELATPAPGGGDWLAFVAATHRSLEIWRARQRRNQVIAASLLSVLALVAAAAILLWAAPSTG